MRVNLSRGVLTKMPGMHYKRWGHGAALLGNKIYVVGGRDVEK